VGLRTELAVVIAKPGAAFRIEGDGPWHHAARAAHRDTRRDHLQKVRLECFVNREKRQDALSMQSSSATRVPVKLRNVVTESDLYGGATISLEIPV